jgi:TonB family protein
MSRSAFGQTDELTLESLSHEVLRILDRKSAPPKSFRGTAETAPPKTEAPNAERAVIEENRSIDSEPNYSSPATVWPEARIDEPAPGRGIEFLTWVFGAAVVAAAVLLTVLLVQRFAVRRSARRAVVPSASSANLKQDSTDIPNQSNQAISGTAGGAFARGASATATARAPANGPGSPVTASLPAAALAKESSPPPGGLLVYENGKEIFRMPAEQSLPTKSANTTATDVAAHPENQTTPIVERAGIYELSPQAAEGSLIHRVEPDYPEDARLQQIQGAVVLQVEAAADGSVREVNVVSGPALLADAAISAVKQWKFKLRIVEGRPTEMQMRVTLNFRLPDAGKAPK